jgi:hypothetical protein
MAGNLPRRRGRARRLGAGEMMHSATRIALISYALSLAAAAAGMVVADDGRTTEPTASRTVSVGARGA